jgi:hypothetical protein
MLYLIIIIKSILSTTKIHGDTVLGMDGRSRKLSFFLKYIEELHNIILL